MSNLYLGSSEEKKQHLKDVFEIARGGGFDPYAVQRTLRGRPHSSSTKHFWPKEIKRSRLRKIRVSEPVQEKKAYAQQVAVEDQLIHHIHPTY